MVRRYAGRGLLWRRYLPVLPAILLEGLVCIARAAAAGAPPPHSPGGPALVTGTAALAYPEHAEYRIAWKGIPAGYGKVDVRLEDVEGARMFTVKVSGRTSELVDIFWKYRGQARATFLFDGLQPLRFTLDERENGKRKLLWIEYDHERGGVRGIRFKKGKRRVYEAESPEVVDPIVAVFRGRAAKLRERGEVFAAVFTGRRRYDVRLRVTGHGTIEVPAGRFPALRLQPEVLKYSRKHPGRKRPDRRLKRAEIWVSDDAYRVPLQIRARIFVGEVTLELLDMRPRVAETRAGGEPSAAPVPLSPTAAARKGAGR